MRHLLAVRVAVLPLFWLSVASAPAPATTPPSPPTIYNLGTLGGTDSYGQGINALGQVTGYSSNGSGVNHAFLYSGVPGSGGAMVDLGTLPGGDGPARGSFGYGINASGQIAGSSVVSGGNLHVFRYTGIPGGGGAMADLGALDIYGTYAVGQAINNSGQVAGWSMYRPVNWYHAFLYTGTPGAGGTLADLGDLGGGVSYGYSLNDSGQVAGFSETTGGSADHAFLYSGTPGSGGAMADLGTLGGSTSIAAAINALGQVAGWSSTGSGVSHAFLYTGMPGVGGSMADLGTLGGTWASGLAINDSGQVAGASYTGSGARRAFLYTGTPGLDGQMIDLDTWLDANNPTEGAKWTLSSASGLTAAGLLTGDGVYNDGPGGLSDGTRAFLLNASALVPEPASAALLTAAALVLAARRRRVGSVRHGKR